MAWANEAMMGGRILAGLVRETNDEWARSALVRERVEAFPIEPFRYLGAIAVREAAARSGWNWAASLAAYPQPGRAGADRLCAGRPRLRQSIDLECSTWRGCTACLSVYSAPLRWGEPGDFPAGSFGLRLGPGG